MSADTAAASPAVKTDLRFLRVIRYAVGTTIAMAVAMGFNWPLAYIVPVLSLGFLATPDPCPTPAQGLKFVAVVSIASFLGLQFAGWFLPFPLVCIALVGLVLFRIFYAKASGGSPVLIMWLMISFTVIPLVGLMSPGAATLVALAIPAAAAVSMLLIWLVYFIFPDPREVTAAALAASAPPEQQLPPHDERFRIAVETTLVVMPLLVLFYLLQLTNALLILIFVTMLSSQPGFAKNFKAGVMLLLGNLIGCLSALVIYETLVLMPEYYFLLLVTLLTGLIFGGQLFSGKKSAPLFGMAFSTVLLVLGSAISGSADDDVNPYERVVQIMIAVTYVVTAFGVIDAFRGRMRIPVFLRRDSSDA
jgi:hypothetical protein